MSIVWALPKSHRTQFPVADCRMFSPLRSLQLLRQSEAWLVLPFELHTCCAGHLTA